MLEDLVNVPGDGFKFEYDSGLSARALRAITQRHLTLADRNAFAGDSWMHTVEVLQSHEVDYSACIPLPALERHA